MRMRHDSMKAGKAAPTGRPGRLVAAGVGMLVLAALPGGAHGAAAGSCGPSLLGDPCPVDGVATQADPGSDAGLGAGNPIHLATGNKYQRETDLPALPGALGVELVRHYNSRDVRDAPLGRNWGWSYDTRLFRVGPLLQIVQADGSRVDFSRDGDDAATCVPADPAMGRLHLRAGPHGEIALWQWRDGRVLRFDEDGFLTDITLASGVALAILRERAPGRQRGLLREVRDPQGGVLRFRYVDRADGAARLAAVDTPAGSFTYAQDEAGRLSTVAHPGGAVRDYLYEPTSARLTGIVLRTPGAAPRRVRSWAYDAQGRAVLSVRGRPDARTGRVTVRYGKDGAEVRDAAGLTRVAFARAGGRAVLRSVQGKGCEGCAPVGAGRRHDAAGRVTQAGALRVDRDAAGRVVGWQEPAGEARVRWLADTGLPEEVDLPSSVPGRRRSLRIDWLRFDDPGTGLWRAVPARFTETGWRETAGALQALSRSWTLDWEVSGGVARWRGVRPPVATLADAQTTAATATSPGPAVPGWAGLRWTRDDFGLPLRAAGAPGDVGSETRAHDAAGRLAARRFADGTVWTYHHDAAGQLVGHRAEGGGEVVDTTIDWQDGVPVRLRHPEENEDRRVDRARGVTVRDAWRPGPTAGDAPLRYRETLVHDAQGRLTRHVLPEGGELAYDWTAGGLRAIRYTAPGETRAQVLFAQAAAPGSRLRRWFNGVRARVASGRVLQVVGRAGVLLGVARQHDAAGRVVAELDHLADRAAATPWPAFTLQRFGYDARQRLASVATRAGVAAVPATWRAAPADFRAWRPGGDAARWTSAGMSVAPRRTRLPGGLPRQVDGFTLRYGAARRLTVVARGGLVVARYRHNAFGERIVRQRGDGAPSHDFYVGRQLVAEQGDGPVGTVARRYVYAGHEPVAVIDYPGGRRVDGRSPDGEVRLLAVHADLRGAPRVLTDAAQTVRWRGWLDAFGALRAERGDVPMRLRLPGQVADPETGWHDNYLRTYDPRGGDYLEPDPLGAEPGTAAFGYAAQQPGRFIDPLGLLLFAFDGTNNDPSDRTNVYMMAQWYEEDPDQRRNVYYVTGTGTQDARDEAFGDVWSGYSAKLRVQDQWYALLRALQALPTDAGVVQIDVVGFSRGSASAREFANRLSAAVTDGRFRATSPLTGTVSACVNLRFLGVFDTVPQILAGLADTAMNYTIPAGWDAVAHAVALDEHRTLFPLTTMEGGPDGHGAPASPVTELGFIGAHSDLGGGYLYQQDGKDYGDLSDVSLNWMLAQAQAAGVAFGNIPTAQRTVTDPVVHRQPNYDLTFPGADADRAVNRADSTRVVDRQADHALYGDALRAQLAAFVAPFADPVDTPTGAAVGAVDMAAYLAWLKQTRDMGLLH